MCSICGMIDFKNNNISEACVKKMGGTMPHRGPDQNGVFSDKSVAFQHNRLAIIDIQNGIQPMTRVFEGKEYTIVYNGEIYNAPELTKELSDFGIEMQTRCDTEVVLYAYIVFKDKCPEKLNGIFAFAVYDKTDNRVFIARDRFGIKPLFYTQVGSLLLFASEIKALLAHPQVKRDVDFTGLWQLLYLSPVKLNGSGIFENIHEVKPAQCGYFSGDRLSLDSYWKFTAKELKVTSDEAAEQTRILLTDAIERQLVSDAPLCTFLSGGLDSSIITSVASKYLNEKGETLSSYSFEYEGNKENFTSTLFQPQGDDEYAVYLADYLKTDHTIITAPTEAVADLLTNAVSSRDIPGQADIDSSLLYFCSIIKQKHTVALSGECADEIFGGYPWFYRKEMLDKDFFPWIHDPFKRVNLFNSSMIRSRDGYSFLSEQYRNSLNECPVLDSDSNSMLLSRRATWLSVNYFMTSLLERKDRMSMASGVEVRVPFADHRILEYVFNLPWEIKFENQVEKALLRKSMSSCLPDRILNRKKSPYPKTHNPQYEKTVHSILMNRLKNKQSLLNQILCREELDKFLDSDNSTWFGQLMSKPQMIAWLIQLDFWFDSYNINLLI